VRGDGLCPGEGAPRCASRQRPLHGVRCRPARSRQLLLRRVLGEAAAALRALEGFAGFAL